MRRHDETDTSNNPGIFRGLVDFVVSLDSVLEKHLKTATVYKGTSKTIQNKLLDCRLSVLKDYILEDAKTGSSSLSSKVNFGSCLFKSGFPKMETIPGGWLLYKAAGIKIKNKLIGML